MKIVSGFVAVLCVVGLASAARPFEDSPARFTVLTVDEDGSPLERMSVVGGFYGQAPLASGMTDSNGLFVVDCKKAMAGEGGFSVNHGISGYYETHAGVRLKEIVGGRWEPWNPVVTAVVRQVLNPIPMYMKAVTTMFPETNRLCGFDLTKGDWVAPNGVGEHADVFFGVDRTIVSKDDFLLTFRLVFSTNDGFQPFTAMTASAFPFPRYAPTDGYAGNYERQFGRRPKTGFFNTEPSPAETGVYRVRTLLDERGEIKAAQYGVFDGGFQIVGYIAEKITIKFTYYLNPTPNDRNLEFDPKRNLFTNLKPSEQVTSP